jgi:hypothetical protein
MPTIPSESLQTAEKEWIAFPGGELEGQPPRALCPCCRESLRREAGRKSQATNRPDRRRLLCFQCYRAQLERDRALQAAGRIDTASEFRFQCTLPFEPVNEARLALLKAERTAARAAVCDGVDRFADARHRAQIAARRALRTACAEAQASARSRAEQIAAAIHAAELQLPESWLPFVVAG